ncbi:hypothetical protein Tco_0342984, partial [Tanacetum coccineum]
TPLLPFRCIPDFGGVTVNIAHDVPAVSPQLDNEDLEQIDTDDLEEIDLKW